MNKWVLYSIIALTSFLMVSTWPMLSLKFQNMTLKQNWQKIILLIFGIVGTFVFQWLTIPLIFLLYIVLSLLTENKRA
jgi:CDP-diacylglycerol--serine O-phosphatidyltransferase